MACKKFECKHCNSISTADNINEVTIDNCCINRQQRRQFMPIENTKPTDRKWYQCPACRTNTWRNGFEEVKED